MPTAWRRHHSSLRCVLMPPPPAGAPGPFALSDVSALRKFAADAGLTPVEVFDVDTPFVYADEAHGGPWPQFSRRRRTRDARNEARKP